MPSGVYKRTERSKEYRNNIAKSRVGKSSGNKGKHWSIEARITFSNLRKGKNANNWKGGITQENKKIRKGIEYRLWREAVFSRDNWTCQICKKQGYRLHPHHIKNFSNFPELRFAIDNGITLCEDCHKNFHKKFGWSNNSRKQLEDWEKQINEFWIPFGKEHNYV